MRKLIELSISENGDENVACKITSGEESRMVLGSLDVLKATILQEVVRVEADTKKILPA